MAIDIRAAHEDDLPVLVRLQSQVTQTSLETALPVFRRMAQYPHNKAYLAYHDGAAIGTFTLLVLDNMGHGGAPFAVVENVVVDAPARRTGVGRAMMEAALDIARAHGCYKLVLGSNLRLTEAHAFYESLGFTKQGYAFSIGLMPADRDDANCITALERLGER